MDSLELDLLLLFLFILFVAYLPNQPESIDADLKEERSRQADLIRRRNHMP